MTHVPLLTNKSQKKPYVKPNNGMCDHVGVESPALVTLYLSTINNSTHLRPKK